MARCAAFDRQGRSATAHGQREGLRLAGDGLWLADRSIRRRARPAPLDLFAVGMALRRDRPAGAHDAFIWFHGWSLDDEARSFYPLRASGDAASLRSSSPSNSASFDRARLRRLLIVPISTPQICAASS